MDFTGKTAFITGAARGIGRATAIGFAKNGANVVVADIADLTETCEQIKKYTENVIAINFDVSDETAARNAVAKAAEKFGKTEPGLRMPYGKWILRCWIRIPTLFWPDTAPSEARHFTCG